MPRLVSVLALVLLVAACQRVEADPVCKTALDARIETDAVVAHLHALQAIADENDGTRASGTPGYGASVEYVTLQLEDAGYFVETHAFEFDRFTENGPSQLEQTMPAAITYEHGIEFATAQFSMAGDVTAPVDPVDLELGLDNESSSGCEPEDFAAFGPGNIALVQRGTCTFAQKVATAEEAGATAVIIFNQGDTDDRQGLFSGTLGSGSDPGVPVIFATYGLGEFLAGVTDDGLVLHIVVDAETTTETGDSITADTPTGDPQNVVMLGAHLDSVPAGPGINDNGSGSAILLETAIKLMDCEPTNLVRFGWWGAEEYGLVGSSAYVADLDAEETGNIGVYLNFDMTASPNYVHFVLDADGSSYDVDAPAGSAALEGMLREHFDSIGVEAHDAALNGRSDYLGFMQAGIPVGGTFTGAEGTKSADQADAFGGDAEQAFDPCYHLACDTIDNVAVDALEQNAGAAAFAVETLGSDLSVVGR